MSVQENTRIFGIRHVDGRDFFGARPGPGGRMAAADRRRRWICADPEHQLTSSVRRP